MESFEPQLVNNQASVKTAGALLWKALKDRNQTINQSDQPIPSPECSSGLVNVSGGNQSQMMFIDPILSLLDGYPWTSIFLISLDFAALHSGEETDSAVNQTRGNHTQGQKFFMIR